MTDDLAKLIAEIRKRLAEARRYNDFAISKGRLAKSVTLSTDETEQVLNALVEK